MDRRHFLEAAAGLPAARVSSRRFNDGEVWVRIEDDVRGRDVVVVQGTHPPQEVHLQELYELV